MREELTIRLPVKRSIAGLSSVCGRAVRSTAQAMHRASRALLDEVRSGSERANVGNLTFESPDPMRFPALRLARESLNAGGTAPTVLNAANEVAVDAFLAGELAWTGIAGVLAAALDAWPGGPADCVESVLDADRSARRSARALVESQR